MARRLHAPATFAALGGAGRTAIVHLEFRFGGGRRGQGRLRLPPAVDRLAAEFPTVGIELASPAACADVRADAWLAGVVDLWAFDREVDRLALRPPLVLCVAGPQETIVAAARAVLTRCQRCLGLRNEGSAGTAFDAVLAAHRAAHDIDRPLVQADYAHALDVWQWTLRLDPAAGLAVQLAALFHDIERLASESGKRREHRAPDYAAFKAEHARRGAAIADRLLADLGIDSADRRRAVRLIAAHDAPGESRRDRDGALLADADALSFLVLNSAGYLDYFGPEATERKLAWTLARLSPAGRRRLAGLWLPLAVARLMARAAGRPAHRRPPAPELAAR